MGCMRVNVHATADFTVFSYAESLGSVDYAEVSYPRALANQRVNAVFMQDYGEWTNVTCSDSSFTMFRPERCTVQIMDEGYFWKGCLERTIH